jgi:hypothetical protein
VHVGAMMDAMTRGKLETLDAECLRPHYARTLRHWADALEERLGEARRVLGNDADKIVRAYRLYLAGSAMGFEQGWISLFQILASRLDGVVGLGEQSPDGLRATQSGYPFNRGYVYAEPKRRSIASSSATISSRSAGAIRQEPIRTAGDLCGHARTDSTVTGRVRNDLAVPFPDDNAQSRLPRRPVSDHLGKW